MICGKHKGMDIYSLASAIEPVDLVAARACAARFDNVAKPVGSLGRLEALLIQIAKITGTVEIDIGKKAAAVFWTALPGQSQGAARAWTTRGW